MCFSAEASFTAAAVLALMGAVTLKSASSRPQLFLAMIPCLFAIQQFSEGILWYELGRHLAPNVIARFAQRAFLTFAFLIWPIWIPLSLMMLERITWRRNILYAILACGITLSFLNLLYAIQQDLSVKIANHSLQYLGNAPPQSFLYPLIVLLPCFISSYKNVWVFGLFVLIAYFVADYYYSSTFISVWCFFAAIVSTMVYKLIKGNQAYPETTRTP